MPVQKKEFLRQCGGPELPGKQPKKNEDRTTYETKHRQLERFLTTLAEAEQVRF